MIVNEAYQVKVDGIVTENIQISKADWNSFETAWGFMRHPLAGMEQFGFDSRTSLRRKYLNTLVKDGRLKMTLPDKPKSKNQKYYS